MFWVLVYLSVSGFCSQVVWGHLRFLFKLEELSKQCLGDVVRANLWLVFSVLLGAAVGIWWENNNAAMQKCGKAQLKSPDIPKQNFEQLVAFMDSQYYKQIHFRLNFSISAHKALWHRWDTRQFIVWTCSIFHFEIPVLCYVLVGLL